MKQTRLAALTLILCAGLGATGVAEAAGPGSHRLTPVEIRALAPGSYDGYFKNSLHIRITLNPDGSAQGSAGGIPHSGSWQERNGNFCLTVSLLFFSTIRCGAIYTDGRRFYGMPNKQGKPRLIMSATGLRPSPV